jgi:hypothetical protein
MKFENTEVYNKLYLLTEVTKRPNGSFSFEWGSYGIMDYFPGADKLLIRKENKWIIYGKDFIIDSILPNLETLLNVKIPKIKKSDVNENPFYNPEEIFNYEKEEENIDWEDEWDISENPPF